MSVTIMKTALARRPVARLGRMQRGMSMMELMVGLAIGMILTLGMFTVIVSTSQSFRVNDEFSRMQENAASAFRYLGESIRQAGFYGNAKDTGRIFQVAGFNVATTTDCGSAAITPQVNFALDFATPIRAYMGYTPTSVNADWPCILQQNFNQGPPVPITNPNPILVTRGASGYRVCNAIVTGGASPPSCPNSNSLLVNQPNFAATIYVQADPYQGIVYYGGDYAAIRGTASARRYPNTNDMEMFEYRAHVYYIRPCSRPAGGVTNCTGPKDDDGAPIPTLVRQELVGSVMTEVPLVEGIDMIDYRFGVDTSSPTDGVADFYTNNIVSVAQWAQVVSVKVTLLVRSPHINIEYDDSGKTYDLLGDGVSAIYRCTSYAPPSDQCKYKRKVFSQTIQVRNIAQRNGG